jgi:hypothetical protein
VPQSIRVFQLTRLVARSGTSTGEVNKRTVTLQ